jgi:hypothetical protein
MRHNGPKPTTKSTLTSMVSKSFGSENVAWEKFFNLSFSALGKKFLIYFSCFSLVLKDGMEMVLRWKGKDSYEKRGSGLIRQARLI